MELMQPYHGLAAEPTSGFFSPVGFRRGFDSPAANSQLSEIFEETSGGGGGGGFDKVHVAVGKSVEKAVSLLRWSVKQFGGRELCILHVHQPAQHIPTLCK